MRTEAQRFLRRPEVCNTIARSSASLHNDIKRGVFPPPVRIGPNAAAWPDREVAAVQAARIANKTEDEIRDLVRRIVAARTAEPVAA